MADAAPPVAVARAPTAAPTKPHRNEGRPCANPACGKPLWLTLGDPSTYQLFFDDNIHNDVKDSIVSVRARRDAAAAGGFAPLTGAQICALHGAVRRRALPACQSAPA